MKHENTYHEIYYNGSKNQNQNSSIRQQTLICNTFLILLRVRRAKTFPRIGLQNFLTVSFNSFVKLLETFEAIPGTTSKLFKLKKD